MSIDSSNNKEFRRNWLWALGREIATMIGLRDPLRDLIWKYQTKRADSRREKAFQRFCAGLDRETVSAHITAVILTVDPSHLFEKCLATVKKQNLPPGRIEVVRNVSPVSKASQDALDRVKTPFYVLVDDDMVLKPSCFERLYYVIKSHPNCAEAVAMLSDPLLGKISGVHMFKTDDVRAIGFHPFADEKTHDRYMTAKLSERGKMRVICGIVEGEHHPTYLPHEAFWKFRFEGEKARYYNDHTPTFRHWVDRILDYWKRTRDDIALYALAGLFAGLQSEDIDQELSYRGRLTDQAFLKVQDFLNRTARHNKNKSET